MRKLIILGVIGMVTVSATQAAALELTNKVEKSETHSLHIPDEVAPAVEPYLACRLQSLGATISGKDGKRVKPLVTKGGDCLALRTRAAADADALLAKAGKDDSYRAATIEETLKSIDDFAEVMSGAMAGAKEKTS
ncbi:hypothetical protein G4G27_11320 [Sphingomonas sp. So64.6b]|uniref:hypothetical protein n=1 Tax=Sphingomonas sp. So64.6b TaxID=2997354 RepID=UPI001600460F|nr:hypothetical protein [Sphingomonas sp. So64.6b]QNA84514.1 hypothetical protein G4G27_11320 [Sphingomonas sp. So64.6b]